MYVEVVPIQTLTSTDAFVVTDIPDAPATGVVRMARKILQSSATDLARSATYTFASFDMARSGASGGINAEGDATADALAAFIDEIGPSVADGSLHLDPAKGIPSGGFDGLIQSSGRSALAGSTEATVAGVMAATEWALGALDGKSVAIEGAGDVPDALRTAITEAGGSIVTVEGLDKKPWMIWGAKADAILCGSKMGTLTHQGADFVKASAIVPWGAIPVTTKAFAQLRRNDVAVLPDFISAAGGLLAGYLEGDASSVTDQVRAMVTAALDELRSSDEGPMMAACLRAEAYLATWTDTKPFGRPLAA